MRASERASGRQAHLLQLLDLVRALAVLPLEAVRLCRRDAAAVHRRQQLVALRLKALCSAEGRAGVARLMRAPASPLQQLLSHSCCRKLLSQARARAPVQAL